MRRYQMRIKFIKPLVLYAGDGVVHGFTQGKTYEMADYWALQIINSGEAVEVEPLEAQA